MYQDSDDAKHRRSLLMEFQPGGACSRQCFAKCELAFGPSHSADTLRGSLCEQRPGGWVYRKERHDARTKPDSMSTVSLIGCNRQLPRPCRREVGECASGATCV